MRALLLFLLSFLTPPQGALPPTPEPINQTFQFSQPATTPGTYEAGSGSMYHRLTWWSQGTVITCQVQVDVSLDGLNWVLGFAIGTQTCTSPGQVITQIAVQQFNYSRINVTSFTGVGTLFVNYVSTPAQLVQLSAIPSGGNTIQPLVFSNPAVPAFTTGSEVGQPGLGARNPGVGWFIINQAITTSGNNGVMFNVTDSFASFACYATLSSPGGTGTTPTLNVYVQDSGDGANWNDRISFSQITTTASRQIAGITGSGSLTPTAATDGTLAAGTILNGPIGPSMRVRWIVTGTTPSFTTTIVVWCW